MAIDFTVARGTKNRDENNEYKKILEREREREIKGRIKYEY